MGHRKSQSKTAKSVVKLLSGRPRPRWKLGRRTGSWCQRPTQTNWQATWHPEAHQTMVTTVPTSQTLGKIHLDVDNRGKAIHLCTRLLTGMQEVSMEWIQEVFTGSITERLLLWPFLQWNFSKSYGQKSERIIQADNRKPKNRSPKDQMRREGFPMNAELCWSTSQSLSKPMVSRPLSSLKRRAFLWDLHILVLNLQIQSMKKVTLQTLTFRS